MACADCAADEVIENPLDWWPQGSPTDVDLSTLPAAGATSSKLRLPGKRLPWVGIWGEFAGLRIGLSTDGKSFPIRSGTALAYLGTDLDMYLSVDTGSWGKASFGRFHTQEAALAWGGKNSFSRTTAAPLGPFPAATALSDADPNPTTTRVGANLLAWDRVAAQWKRVQMLDAGAGDRQVLMALGDGVGGTNVRAGCESPADGTTGQSGVDSVAYGMVRQDRSAVYDRLRQPDSYKRRVTLNKAISVATTGVKSTLTMAQNGIIVAASFTVTTQLNSGGNTVIVLNRTTNAGADTVTLGITTMPTGTVVAAVQDLMADIAIVPTAAGTSTAALRQPYLQVLSGDVIDLNVLTAATVAGAGSFTISVLEERAAF